MDPVKLDQLKCRIDQFKQSKSGASPAKKSLIYRVDSLTIAIELVAGTMIGLIIGSLLDRTLNSAPLGLIICLLLGMLASFKVIWQKIK